MIRYTSIACMSLSITWLLLQISFFIILHLRDGGGTDGGGIDGGGCG